MNHRLPTGLVPFALTLLCSLANADTSFVNFETPHVTPLATTPDGTRLLAVNTADNRVEIFDISAGLPVAVGAVPVGLDPVSVAALDDTTAWVANLISDSISVVDLETLNVSATIRTADEPADIVFAGTPRRAFVSCSQANLVEVFDLETHARITTIPILGEDPRAMAVSPDGATIYVAVFESGNATTILGGGADVGLTGVLGFPPNVVSLVSAVGPYNGVNPPPNDGDLFNPPINVQLPDPPAVGLIVRKSVEGLWIDDNAGDWTPLVSGFAASFSGRVVGWDMPDRDLAIIDASTFKTTYARRLMNICMALAVNPASGAVTVVGTDALNHVRFEPVINGRFLRVNMATVDAGDPDSLSIIDLNPHLDYTTKQVDQKLRQQSLGDPRGIVWTADGSMAYVTGMGSNNVVTIAPDGTRLRPPIGVGEGPTGIVLNEAAGLLYVLNKFEGSVSVIDMATSTESARIALFDPTPQAITLGRRHLYDTHEGSGLGHIACASCHVDARIDRLAWDLGDPSGTMKDVSDQNCNFGGADFAPQIFGACEDFHPMKGPMLTQTMQDIIGHEPLHWRGDRDGLEEFNPAFVGLQASEKELSPDEMQAFEDFLASIHFPPNPFRNLDNTLPEDLPLPGHFATGRFLAAGTPLPNGNAVHGLDLYRHAMLDANVLNCATCHTLPTGMGTNRVATSLNASVDLPPGNHGEMHHAVVTVDGSTNPVIKIPQLRNLYERVGFDMTQQDNVAGFGFLHDGSIDSIARFVGEDVFQGYTGIQDIADMVAFMLAFSGSDLPVGGTNDAFELRGPDSQDAHAAVGYQLTLNAGTSTDPVVIAEIDALLDLTDSGTVGVVAHGRRSGEQRGYFYDGTVFVSDRLGDTLTATELRMAVVVGAEMTLTVVPAISAIRMALDRDEDGYYNRDELDACRNPADPASVPCAKPVPGDHDCDQHVALSDYASWSPCFTGPAAAAGPACVCELDLVDDDYVDLEDYAHFQKVFTGE